MPTNEQGAAERGSVIWSSCTAARDDTAILLRHSATGPAASRHSITSLTSTLPMFSQGRFSSSNVLTLFLAGRTGRDRGEPPLDHGVGTKEDEIELQRLQRRLGRVRHHDIGPAALARGSSLLSSTATPGASAARAGAGSPVASVAAAMNIMAARRPALCPNNPMDAPGSNLPSPLHLLQEASLPRPRS